MERVVNRTSFMENTKSYQQRRVSLMPFSPTQMLWSAENGSGCNKDDKDKGVNVQVILRCRPFSEDDVRAKTPAVVACNEDKQEVIVTQNMGNKQIDKTFSFDKVFGPSSRQKDLYDQVVGPIVREALEGYNWTIFAYGQTGTGKTYTMEGEGGKAKNGEFHEDVGVIPRAVEQLFDTLEAQNAEYSMKVTYIELYNEEITDLLALDDKSKKPITLMEDGKGAVFMRGLEEELVRSADEIYHILQKGSARKHTAETLINTQSNRSHSLFTIIIQIKEHASDGVEVIKCGKLNLVDLAGSENISRSGAREGRAREAGEINKSLLTLGRVINALVDHSGHVPYRDSKLTRLLRDSLGGETKTCIIATVSPSIHSLEETQNTLDYAYRAKSIKNRPEVNHKATKSVVVKELYTEIDSLKQELHATREKNGIYIPHDRYLSEEAAKKAMTEELELKSKELMDLQELFFHQQKLTTELSQKLENTERLLQQRKQDVSNLKNQLRQANETTKEKEYFILNLLGSEKTLTERAVQLHSELENATSEVSSLFAKIDHKNHIEEGNKVLIKSFQMLLAQHLEVLHNTIVASVTHQEQHLNAIEERMRSFVSEQDVATEGLQIRVKKIKEVFSGGIKSLVGLATEFSGNSETALSNINSEAVKHSSALAKLIREASVKVGDILDDLQSNLNDQEQSIAAFWQQQHESQLRAYETTQSASSVTVNFFKTLSKDIFGVIQMVEEARTMYYKKLSEFTKKFEDYADSEDRQILAKMTELLASSNAKKKQLVQTEVNDIQSYIGSKTYMLHHKVSDMHGFLSSTEDEYTSFLEKTKKHYIEDKIVTQNGQDGLTAILQNWTTKARTGNEGWKQVQESLSSLQKMHIESVDSTINDALETNQAINTQLSSLASSTVEEIDIAQSSSLPSVEYLLRINHEENEAINSLTKRSRDTMKDMETVHSAKIIEITKDAEKCLINDYMVDDSLFSTPKLCKLPSKTHTKELKTPPFEVLLDSFRKSRSEKQENADLNAVSFGTINGG
ncbi:kinesin-like protein KIN-5D isoform X2 [Cynara cardunculus var. scolymus]|uniref:kinesin-like protein KIN-5D isoform X2 n=1 Tax=Cynara cardunculus var. scolymus TaxID=59895 RepID=UPI000D62F184|nr:kinesin-like protein KIN-5D isoform X2 [Cynara cardunculus var. scolymus]